jgi:Prophage minor tail protein Z (GPZ)
MPLAVDIKAEGFKEAEKALRNINGGYPTVASRAINRALGTGEKVIAQAVSARYNIKSGEVKKDITQHKATKGDLYGELEIKGGMLPVSLFKPTGGQALKGGGGKRRPIKVAVLRKAPKIIRSAFKMPDGRIMERRQPERFPVFVVSTVGVPFMAAQTGVSDKVEKEMARTAALRLKHETEFMLSKEGFK